MATTYEVNGATVKERNPFGVWALVFLTLGIYYLVWYYKINKEMRRAQDIDVDPAMSVLAITLGAILIVPPFVSLYKTGRRVERAQFKGAVRDRISPVLSFILSFFLALHVIYIQSNLNKLWTRSGSTTDDKHALPDRDRSAIPQAEAQPMPDPTDPSGPGSS